MRHRGWRQERGYISFSVTGALDTQLRVSLQLGMVRSALLLPTSQPSIKGKGEDCGLWHPQDQNRSLCF